ncbi:hypothetical protein [Xanthomonas campestris]|uniref:hypothetical protein n=1 Tax=Xanthomonas campestris TaxID=339 RepID=UPI0023793FA5|nr:hypothetical protein [Xanthomonas campestris]WDK04530.1 hypothetical protein JH273_21680 [Xanthomonas campestris]
MSTQTYVVHPDHAGPIDCFLAALDALDKAQHKIGSEAVTVESYALFEEVLSAWVSLRSFTAKHIKSASHHAAIAPTGFAPHFAVVPAELAKLIDALPNPEEAGRRRLIQQQEFTPLDVTESRDEMLDRVNLWVHATSAEVINIETIYSTDAMGNGPYPKGWRVWFYAHSSGVEG